MSKAIIDSIPVSPFCQYAIRANKGGWRFMVLIAVVLIVLACVFFSVWLATLCSVVVGILASKVSQSFKNDERWWLDINKKDYDVSMQLEDMLRAFYHYSEQDIYRAGVVEGQVDSLWAPVYAQYFSGERSLSADVSVSGTMFGLFTSAGELSGKVIGSVAPDSLSDLGAVLILQNEQGRSVRVVVPHRQVAKQMLSTVLDSFNKDNKCFNTLTSQQILRISLHLPAKACVTFVSALHVLDQIVATCGKPLAERSMVKVYGKEVSPGVIMATALEIEGERGIFIPTGYIKEVTDKLAEFLGSYRGDVGMLLDGQGPFAPKETQPAL